MFLISHGRVYPKKTKTPTGTSASGDERPSADLKLIKEVDEHEALSSGNEGTLGVVAVERATAYISSLLKQKKELQMVSIIDKDYGEIAEFFGEGVDSRNELRDVRQHMCDVFTTFPLGTPQIIIVHHENSVVTFGKSATGIGILALAPTSVSLGMVHMLVRQIANKVDQIVETEHNCIN